MKILVTGTDSSHQDITAALDTLAGQFQIKTIHSSDPRVIAWAQEHKIPCTTLPATWTRFGSSSPKLRDREILTVAKPDIVVMLDGTSDTLATMAKARVKTHDARGKNRLRGQPHPPGRTPPGSGQRGGGHGPSRTPKPQGGPREKGPRANPKLDR